MASTSKTQKQLHSLFSQTEAMAVNLDQILKLDPLEVLKHGPASYRHYADAVELATIEHARAFGYTWQEIADALGLTSRQAAQQRYDRLK